MAAATASVIRPADREHTFAPNGPRSPLSAPALNAALARRALVAAVRAAARVRPASSPSPMQSRYSRCCSSSTTPRRGQLRWLARFAGEYRGVTLGEVHAAFEALDAFPAPDAHATPVALLRRHGIN